MALVEPPDDARGGLVPFGVVDAILVDVEVSPDAVLEGVEVLVLDHQDGPVGDEGVGEEGDVGPAVEALGGERGRWT